ncbi:MAG: AAA family ATPase [bacterium]|nr:AAA family ATPase [bacterium]
MKKLPVGISDFRKIISQNYYYVDKTLFIKEIIDNGDDILLIPRPRRFGKTLNLSLLKYFYDCCPDDGIPSDDAPLTPNDGMISTDTPGNSYHLLFDSLAIRKSG